MNYRDQVAHRVANKVRWQLQQGFYLFEMTIAMIVLASLMTLGAKQLGKNIQHLTDQATAYHFQAVYEAAHGYVLDNLSEFDKSETFIDIQKLRDSKRLVNHIQDTNSYNQKYNIVVLQDVTVTPKVLKLLVATSGGKDIHERTVRNIAGQVGPEAGYASVAYPGKIKGSQGSWEMKASETSLKIKPGYLAGIAVLNEADVMDLNYFKDGMLYRKEMKGHPEYNRMETDLEMVKDKKILLGSNKDTNFTAINNDSINLQKNNASTDTWTTQIKPSEIHLKRTGSARNTYIGSDFIVYRGEPSDTVGQVRISETALRVTNQNGTIGVVITPTSIRGSKIIADSTIEVIGSSYVSSIINAESSTDVHISNSGVKLPFYVVDEGFSVMPIVRKFCGDGVTGFANKKDGKLFIVRNIRELPRLYLCYFGYGHRISFGAAE